MNIAKIIGFASLLTIGSSASTFAGCCAGMDPASKAECHASTAAANTNSAGNPILSLSAQTVLDNYLKVQSNLAQDSVEGLPDAANAIVAAVGDGKDIPAAVAQQAQALAAARDIDTAREAFKPLSKSLIAYLRGQNALTGNYKEAYCPMVRAGWIQTENQIANPYMGKAMLHCGQFKS